MKEFYLMPLVFWQLDIVNENSLKFQLTQWYSNVSVSMAEPWEVKIIADKSRILPINVTKWNFFN